MSLVQCSSMEISMEECAELIEQSQLSATLDLGSVLIHDATHSVMGEIQIVNTINGRSALIRRH